MSVAACDRCGRCITWAITPQPMTPTLIGSARETPCDVYGTFHDEGTGPIRKVSSAATTQVPGTDVRKAPREQMRRVSSICGTHHTTGAGQPRSPRPRATVCPA